MLLCCREVVAAHHDHLEAALKTVIHNELGAARNPGNMQLMVMLITSQKDLAAKVISLSFPLSHRTTNTCPSVACRWWLMCSWVSCASERTASGHCAIF